MSFFTKRNKVLFLTHISRNMNQFSCLKFATYINCNKFSLIQVEGVGTRKQSRDALLRWQTIHPQHKCKENSIYSAPIVWGYSTAIIPPKTELTIHKTFSLPQLMQKEAKKFLGQPARRAQINLVRVPVSGFILIAM